ncbi:MAG TPA: hypothetical protein VKZ41_12980 [Gemmatimonadales bacterium]|nr:hypothetical protein [Gemmatimonadales bacterium]
MPTLLLAVALLVASDAGSTSIIATPAAKATTNATVHDRASASDDVLAKALAAHMKRMEGIDNYTVVQTTMGVESTTYFEKEVVNGKPHFRPRTIIAAGQRIENDDDADEDMYEALAAYSERATLRGMETVDGKRTYAVVVEDFSGLPGMGDDDIGDVEFDRATLFIDADSYVLRRMEMEGTRREDGEEQPVRMTGRFEDYRQVRGMLHPFRTVITLQGEGAGLSELELAEARRDLAELKAQMESMPAAQRRMMESALRPRMEQFEAMLGGEGVDIQIDVKEVRVNQGPPA